MFQKQKEIKSTPFQNLSPPPHLRCRNPENISSWHIPPFLNFFLLFKFLKFSQNFTPIHDKPSPPSALFLSPFSLSSMLSLLFLLLFFLLIFCFYVCVDGHICRRSSCPLKSLILYFFHQFFLSFFQFIEAIVH